MSMSIWYSQQVMAVGIRRSGMIEGDCGASGLEGGDDP